MVLFFCCFVWFVCGAGGTKGLKGLKNKKLEGVNSLQVCRFVCVWSWRELNPRPNKETICFLHAYLSLDFRATARPELPTMTLSSKTSLTARGYCQLSPNLLHRQSDRLRERAFRTMSRSNAWQRNKAIYYTSIKLREQNCCCQINF